MRLNMPSRPLGLQRIAVGSIAILRWIVVDLKE